MARPRYHDSSFTSDPALARTVSLRVVGRQCDGDEHYVGDGSNREDLPDEETARRWRSPRMTTVILDREEGEWYATRGVDVVGHGETAADAAAEYCRLGDSAPGRSRPNLTYSS